MDGVERLMWEAATDVVTPGDASERWEALSLGTASEGEISALEAAAVDSAEAARQLEVYRPIDQRTHHRFLERVQQELARPPGPGIEATPISEQAPVSVEAATSPQLPASEATAGEGGKIVSWPTRRSSSSRRRWLAPAVAALAASLLWVLAPQPQVALPKYVLTAESGRQTMRGATPDVVGVLTLSQDDPFELVLRPELAVPRSVMAKVFAERSGGLTPVALTSEVSGTGSIRLSGRFDDTLRATADEVDLWIVVASTGAFPDLDDVDRRRRGQLEPDDHWHLLRYRLQSAPRSLQ